MQAEFSLKKQSYSQTTKIDMINCHYFAQNLHRTEDIEYSYYYLLQLSDEQKTKNATNWEYFYNQSTKLLREKENE